MLEGFTLEVLLLREVLRDTYETALLVVLGENYANTTWKRGDEYLLFAVVFTAFVTSFWLWAAAFGTLTIRLLARSGPILAALQYALPIEEKPIRSMGIVGFLVFFLYLLVSIGLRSAGAVGN